MHIFLPRKRWTHIYRLIDFPWPFFYFGNFYGPDWFAVFHSVIGKEAHGHIQIQNHMFPAILGKRRVRVQKKTIARHFLISIKKAHPIRWSPSWHHWMLDYTPTSSIISERGCMKWASDWPVSNRDIMHCYAVPAHIHAWLDLSWDTQLQEIQLWLQTGRSFPSKVSQLSIGWKHVHAIA